MNYTERLVAAGDKSFSAVKKVAKEIAKRAMDFTQSPAPHYYQVYDFDDGRRTVALDYIKCGQFKVAFAEDARRGTIAIIGKNN